MTTASEKAAHAQQLIDDPVLSDALMALERDAVAKALQANTFDPNEAISALCHLRAAHSIRPQLQSLIMSGMAEERKRPAVA